MLATGSCGDEEPVSSVTRGESLTSWGIVPPAMLAALLLVVATLLMIVCFFKTIFLWERLFGEAVGC